MNDLTSKGWFDSLKDVSELISYITTIIATIIIGIYLTLKQFKFSKDKRTMDERTKTAENSIEVLRIFSTQIIPRIEEIDKEIGKEITKLRELITEKDVDKQILKKMEMSIKFKCGIGRIFNELEQVCVYMSSELVDDDIVYPPLNQMLSDFIERHKDAYDRLIEKAPYKSLKYVLNEWTKKNKLLQLDEEKERIEKERKKIVSQ